MGCFVIVFLLFQLFFCVFDQPGLRLKRNNPIQRRGAHSDKSPVAIFYLFYLSCIHCIVCLSLIFCQCFFQRHQLILYASRIKRLSLWPRLFYRSQIIQCLPAILFFQIKQLKSHSRHLSSKQFFLLLQCSQDIYLNILK